MVYTMLRNLSFVTDMPTLLQRLGLEHYQQRFEEEEVDFDTFLTMSESDLKEMGINTVGARRKLQIAISGTAILLAVICTRGITCTVDMESFVVKIF